MAVSPAEEQLLRDMYAAFNAREIDAVLAHMHPEVDWPDVMEGGRLRGHDAVRSYWAAQFAQMEPTVEPVGFRTTSDDRVAVDVHQVVRDLRGNVQADTRVVHVYTFRDRQIARMDVEEPSPAHHYTARVAWSGSTAEGYAFYDRSHAASCPPAPDDLTLSADPAFEGDPARLNPEQLLVLAASSCQLLSFLAVAARARVDVVGYEDDAEGVMPEADRPMRITRIVLRPRITIRGETPDDDRLHQLVETAHRHCFVASSLTTEIVMEPTFIRTAG